MRQEIQQPAKNNILKFGILNIVLNIKKYAVLENF